MTITELIKELEEILEKDGDLEVTARGEVVRDATSCGGYVDLDGDFEDIESEIYGIESALSSARSTFGL